MKKFVVILSFLTMSFLLNETLGYAQRGRGAGNGGGVNRGATPSQTPPASRGNSDNAGGNSNRPDDTPKATAKDKKPQNKVAEEINLNPKLEERVRTLLPPNMSLDDASAGFKNRGQFISALHVSKNLDIPFAQLRSKMTGANSMSLGESIATLRPMSKDRANDEARRAERATRDIERGPKS